MEKEMNKNDLREYVLNNPNMVSLKETSREGVFVLKYKKKVFYKNLWNEYLEECRGTVVDGDFNVISRPFTKIYNYGIESKSPVLDPRTIVNVIRKINGFMVSVTLHENDILISTTGSIDSDFVKMALELIDRERYFDVCRKFPDLTFMFECVHPNDPHVIPEKVGMYILGYRTKSWDSNTKIYNGHLIYLANEFGCFKPEQFMQTVGELLLDVKDVRHEGFVAYTDDGVSFKMKSPYYLIKKFVSRNPNTEKLMNPDVKKKIDEEYYPLIDHIQENIEMFTAMDEQNRLKWVAEFLEN